MNLIPFCVPNTITAAALTDGSYRGALPALAPETIRKLRAVMITGADRFVYKVENRWTKNACRIANKGKYTTGGQSVVLILHMQQRGKIRVSSALFSIGKLEGSGDRY